MIEDRVKSAEIGTPRGMAVRDYVDEEKARDYWLKDSKNTLASHGYALIKETIRQRRNGVKGYREEYEGFRDEALELRQAVRSSGKDLEAISPYTNLMERVDISYFDRLLGNDDRLGGSVEI